MKYSIQTRKLCALIALGLGHSDAFAQVAPIVVTYGPASVAPVPSLSEWGMILTSLFLAVGAFVALRKKAGSRVIMGLAIACAMGLMASTGHVWVKAAWANGFTEGLMDNPQGGSVTPQIPYGYGVIPVRNSTQVPLRIISVTPEFIRELPATTCKPNRVVQAGATCNVDTMLPD